MHVKANNIIASPGWLRVRCYSVVPVRLISDFGLMEHEHASNRPNLGLALLAKRFVHMLTTGGVKAGARHVKLEQNEKNYYRV